MPEPKNAIRSRPNMPSYGISTTDEGLIEWDWVSNAMEKSRNYWICSTRPDGRPHATPVWGLWINDVFYFGASRSSVKSKNFEHTPQVVVHLESGDDTVILEGIVTEIQDQSLLKWVFQAYAEKYPFNPAEDYDPIKSVYYRLILKFVFAWQESDFPNTATRWEFETPASN